MAQPSDPDLRPALWVGHILLPVPDPQASKRFFMELGLRDAEPGAGPVGILELRGGTHLVLVPRSEPVPEAAQAPFDLMVDDLEGYRKDLLARGQHPGEIAKSDYHRYFTIREPGGHHLTINSTHATGLPV